MINSVEELNDFMMYYYQRRRWSKRARSAKSTKRDQLAEALEYAATPRNFPDMDAQNLALYFFARVARLEPSVIPQYEASLEKVSHGERSFILNVLRLATDDRKQELARSLEGSFPGEFDVLQRPIAGPADLDYLWVEFFVTGSKDPVRKLIEVLAWPDRVRHKLDRWLQKPAFGFFSRWRKKRVLEQLRRVAEIACDATTNTIKTIDDLDCMCVLGPETQFPSSKEFAKIKAALPFDLSQDDMNYVAMKAAARWSLSSNACMHPKVLEICQKEFERHSGDTRHGLEQVIASAHKARMTKSTG